MVAEWARIGAIPWDQRTAAEKKVLREPGTSKKKSFFEKAFKVAVLGTIGVAAGGAALTAAGVIGPGAGVAVKAAAVVPSAGMTAAAGLPAYAPQLAAAQSLTGAGVAGASTSFAVAAKSAAAAVSGAAGLAGSVSAIRNAGMSAEAALPAYGPQLAAVQPTTRSTVTATPDGGQDKNIVLGLIALGVLALFV